MIFRRKRPALFKSGQWHFHQDKAPVHNSILVTDYLTKIGTKTVPHPPYSPDLAPCDFWLFPKLRDCRYETIEEMKEAVTKVIDTLAQEDFHVAFQKLLEQYNVHYSRRRLHRRGLEFPVYSINKSAHTKKSLETYLMILVYIYIHIYIYIYKRTVQNVLSHTRKEAVHFCRSKTLSLLIKPTN